MIIFKSTEHMLALFRDLIEFSSVRLCYFMIVAVLFQVSSFKNANDNVTCVHQTRTYFT